VNAGERPYTYVRGRAKYRYTCVHPFTAAPAKPAAEEEPRGVQCHACGAVSRLAGALATIDGERLCWQCRQPWDDEAAARFLTAASTVFPGSYEVDRDGDRVPLEQLGFADDVLTLKSTDRT
jgi:hypothetical protein